MQRRHCVLQPSHVRRHFPSLSQFGGRHSSTCVFHASVLSTNCNCFCAIWTPLATLIQMWLRALFYFVQSGELKFHILKNGFYIYKHTHIYTYTHITVYSYYVCLYYERTKKFVIKKKSVSERKQVRKRLNQELVFIMLWSAVIHMPSKYGYRAKRKKHTH